jgi:hypothetical protein
MVLERKLSMLSIVFSGFRPVAGSALVFHCPMCGALCHGWGSHLRGDCPLSFGAALRGFRAVGEELAALGHVLQWRTTTSFLIGVTRWKLGAGQAPT